MPTRVCPLTSHAGPRPPTPNIFLCGRSHTDPNRFFCKDCKSRRVAACSCSKGSSGVCSRYGLLSVYSRGSDSNRSGLGACSNLSSIDAERRSQPMQSQRRGNKKRGKRGNDVDASELSFSRGMAKRVPTPRGPSSLREPVNIPTLGAAATIFLSVSSIFLVRSQPGRHFGFTPRRPTFGTPASGMAGHHTSELRHDLAPPGGADRRFNAVDTSAAKLLADFFRRRPIKVTTEDNPMHRTK